MAGDLFLSPKDVSFRNLVFKEGQADVKSPTKAGETWLRVNLQKTRHPASLKWHRIGGGNINTGCPVLPGEGEFDIAAAWAKASALTH